MTQHPSREMRRFNYLLGETEAVYHEMALRLGLSDSALKLLYALYEQGGSMALTALCRASGLSKQTVHSALGRLAQEGAVLVEDAEGRTRRVRLTGQGAVLAENTVGRIIRLEDRVLAGWPREDVATYLSLTERYLRDIRRLAEKEL